MRLREAVRQHFDVAQEIGDEFLIRCPSPDHDDHNPSASVNVVKGLWTCYACGRGGRIDRYMDGVSITETADTDELLSELSRTVEELDQQSVQWLPEKWLEQFNTPHDYWQRRNIPEHVVEEFQLGYDWEYDAVTYPVRDPAGHLLGVVRRRIRDDQLDPYTKEPMPKYKYPRHVDMSECLFAYERIRPYGGMVVVTEGALDAIAFWMVGYPAVAQYGIRLREPQIALLRRAGVDRVVLAYDQDEEGQSSVQRTLEGYTDDKGRYHPPPDLSFAQVQVASWSQSRGKDPMDLTPHERMMAARHAELVFAR